MRVYLVALRPCSQLQATGQPTVPFAGASRPVNMLKCRHFQHAPSRCVAARARRRVSDYSSRRAGGEEENRRRSRASRDYRAPTDQPGYQNGTGQRGAEDYSSRRSGGQEENQRRSRDFSGRNNRQPYYDERGMSPPSPARVSSASSSPRVTPHSPRVTPRRDSPSQTPPWQPPSPSRDSFDAYSQQRDPSFTPLVRKRQSMDYASRRSGTQEENLRRSRDFDSPSSSSSAQQPRSYTPDSYSSSPRDKPQQSPRSQPPVMRKPSTDYSSRRSGGQEENQRRSGDYRSPTPSRQQPQTPYYPPPQSPASSQSYSPRASTPRIERKRSTDYPSRRAGGQEENQRRSGDFASPSRGRGSSREPATRYDYTPPRTRGTHQEEPRPRGVANQDFVPLTGDGAAGPRGGASFGKPRSSSISSTNYSPRDGVRVPDENSPPTRAGRANAERRRSGSYNERRSSGISEENSRRRSVDMITGAIREPSREGPPAGRRMAGGYDQPTYSASKKVKGVPRESKDFVPAAEQAAWQARLQDPQAIPEPPLRDGPKSEADTDWPRVIAGNLPAAFIVFAGIAAVDVYTGFDITRIAVRYGGPGAPPSAVLAFWPTFLAAAGLMSTALTNVLGLEAFGLTAKCPECGTANRAGFKGILGQGETYSRVECENCMADLRFELDNKRVVVERGSEEKKKEALERGRQQALRIAREEAEDARRESSEQYRNPRF